MPRPRRQKDQLPQQLEGVTISTAEIPETPPKSPKVTIPHYVELKSSQLMLRVNEWMEANKDHNPRLWSYGPDMAIVVMDREV